MKSLETIFLASNKNIKREPDSEKLRASTLHKEYSITGTPAVPGKPKPSELDLNGAKPTYAYLNNLPRGANA